MKFSSQKPVYAMLFITTALVLFLAYKFKFTVCDMHKHHPIVPFRTSTTFYILHLNTLFNTLNISMQQVHVSWRFIIYRSTLQKLGHVPPEWVYQTRTLLNHHSSLSIFRPECTRHTSLNLSSSLTHHVSPTSYLLNYPFSPRGKG